MSRDTATAAVKGYYRACDGHPRISYRPTDGGKESTQYADWAELLSVTVTFDGPDVRYVLVGKPQPDDGWRVASEGYGP